MFIKKTIFSYLDSLYPDLYNYETLFGIIPRMNNETISPKQIVDDVIRMFYCDYEFGLDVVCEWMENRPIKSLSPSEEFDLVVF